MPEAADTRGFRVHRAGVPGNRYAAEVATGAGDVLLPKIRTVAVMVNASTGGLSATGDVLSHGPMLWRLVESPVVHASYQTYQVQIALIAAGTGLDFRALTAVDPLGAVLPDEAMFESAARAVGGPANLIPVPSASA